jgi:hypothetical protein
MKRTPPVRLWDHMRLPAPSAGPCRSWGVASTAVKMILGDTPAVSIGRRHSKARLLAAELQ